jgi:type VI protein secretion system component VasF
VSPDEIPLRDRLIAIERDVAHLLDESRAIRTTLHSLVAGAMSEHSQAIQTLRAAADQRTGIWWTAAWILGGLVVLVGAAAWLLEHQVQIVIKP